MACCITSEIAMPGTFIDTLWQQDGELLRHFATMLLPLLAIKVLPLPAQLQPLRWQGKLATALAAKVLHLHRPQQQQSLAGVLSLLLLVLPFWIISALLLYMAAYPWFFEMLILYLCLQDMGLLGTASAIQKALQQHDKPLARQLLSPWVPWDTTELSETGMVKATIELLVTMPAYRLLGTLLAYLLLGAPLALLLAMLWQLQLSWWPQSPRFSQFSKILGWLNYGLFWVPLKLWRLSLAFYGGFRRSAGTECQTTHPALRGHQQLCAASAAMLQIELGGPQKYDGNKVRLQRHCFGPLPSARDINRAQQLVNATLAFWLILLSAIPLLWVGLRWFHTLS
ncbi:cobalamin biosynthesis protein [Shewanella sp. YIC-542]|uniref:cobalamin biosynthesis protein n=1 Tax=Shewanella mytili TaxID=3377111 RepID=UPI00398F8213